MDSSLAVSSMAGEPIMPQVGGTADDRTSEEDVCSICLDAFDSHENPPAVTTCKHAFHLQCILEWSQRSKECPICWQLILLKDPDSQELLSIVENERNTRSVRTVRHVYEDPEVDHDNEHNDTNFEEEEVMGSFGSRRQKQRLAGVGPSQEMYTSLEEFHSLGYTSSSMEDNVESSRSISQTPDNGDCTSNPRVVDNQSPNGSPRKPIAADMHAFSESVKSKFSAASAKYKESISKGTQGLKEKLLAKNSPVKELSRGVQREMSAGFAKLFQRLDPSSKGKHTQHNLVPPPLHANSANTDLSSN